MDKNDKCVILKLQLHLHFQAAILKVHLCTSFSSYDLKGQLHLHFQAAILKVQLCTCVFKLRF